MPGGNTLVISKNASVIVYKSVLLQTDSSGVSIVMDCKDGHIYYMSSLQSRLSKDGLMYNSKTAALREHAGAYLKVYHECLLYIILLLWICIQKITAQENGDIVRFDRVVAAFGMNILLSHYSS